MNSLESSARIRWSGARILTAASGACETVLGRPVSELVGMALHRALRVTEAEAATLDARAQAGGGPAFVMVEVPDQPRPPRGAELPRTYLRLALGREQGEAAAWVLDLSALLKGAPPLQIARLSSSLSHELRNPLSSVKMAVQTLARNSGLSDRDRRRLTIAEREIRTIERMLWLLSEYGRDAPPHLETLPLRALVQQAAEMIDSELVERQVKLELAEPEAAGDGTKVRTDPSRLRPVLAQLLLNVAMGLPQGGTVRALIRPGPDPVLQIEDPASELLPAEHDTLFEPFGSRLARGAGMSLAALKYVMLRQGGSLAAEIRQGSGTVFTLTFPAG